MRFDEWKAIRENEGYSKLPPSHWEKSRRKIKGESTGAPPISCSYVHFLDKTVSRHNIKINKDLF